MSISYIGALLSTLLHDTVQVFTQTVECIGTDYKYNGAIKRLRLRFLNYFS
jgi:hypothetical protein